jgi:trafficking protein particle complex subunit 10
MFPKFAPGAVQYNVIFLHIFVVSVEDLESYRSTTRKMMQDWMNVVANKKNNEWMVVYLPEKTKGSRLFNLGASTSVYEKLKVDFNLRKDR